MNELSHNSDKKPKKRRVAAANPELQHVLALHIRRGVTSAAEVRRLLILQFTESGVPSENTVRDMVKEVMSRDPSGQWTLADAKIEEIPLVLPVWRLARSFGRDLTLAEADWVLRIRTAAQDMPKADVLFLAQLRVAWPGWASWIEPLIAFAPYRNSWHSEIYFEAVNAGHIPAPILSTLALHVIQALDAPMGPEAATFLRNSTLSDVDYVTGDPNNFEFWEEQRSRVIKTLREKRDRT